jgi:hypothetical protein
MDPKAHVMNGGAAIRDASIAKHPSLSLKPDDLLFVAMLTAWVVLVAIVTYLLLGWASAAALITVAGLFGIGTVALQSRPPRRPNRV